MTTRRPLFVSSTGVGFEECPTTDTIDLNVLPPLTGFVAGVGTVVATDTILQAIQKLAYSRFRSVLAANQIINSTTLATVTDGTTPWSWSVGAVKGGSLRRR